MDALLSTGALPVGSTGFDVDNSIQCGANSDNEWFYRDNPTAGNKRTFTFSFWHKRSQVQGYEADNYLMSQGSNARFHFAAHTLRFMFDGNSTEMEAAGKLRDCAAWYHIVLAIDTTQGTNTNRVKAYVNGVEYPFNNNDWPSQNQESSWMSGTDMYFNTRDGDGSYDNNGYWAEVAVIDGSALGPTSFGEFDSDSGIWKPKDFKDDVTFGSQGFYLKFDNASDLGNDSSGNNNDVTLNNLSSADQAVDTPTNNFCTGNDNANVHVVSGQLLTRGGTKYTNPSGRNWQTIIGTVGLDAGKWYWEFETDATGAFLGIADVEDATVPWNKNGYFLGYGDNNSSTTKSLGMYSQNGVIYNDSASNTGLSYGSGNKVACALDMDNRKIYFAVNNNWANSANPANGTNGATWNTSWSDTVYPAGSCAQNNSIFFIYGGYTSLSSYTNTDANGYGGFYYTPPSGFYAICTKNLAQYG